MPKQTRKKPIIIVVLIIITFVLLLINIRKIIIVFTKVEDCIYEKANLILKRKISKEKTIRTNYRDGFYYETLSNNLINKITGKSYPEKKLRNYALIQYSNLVYVRIKYYDFENKVHDDGELIVNKLVAQVVMEIFYKLYLYKYSFSKIKLIEEYNAIDEKSMEDNNTSAFNYRTIEVGDKLSWHAFGLAIDINPLYNPYILENNIYPKTSLIYTNREEDFIGKIVKNDICYQIFASYGWLWGGDFLKSKDYQHFYKPIYNDNIRNKRDD